MELSIGSRIGDYEVIDILGVGGMGKVYKVRNSLSDRVEAMKVLLPNLAANPELADRFMREIKLQASLDHPNIAQLHTALHVDNQLLMLMEFVEGMSLERKLKDGPIPVPQAVDAIMQTLSALEFAHSRGVIHRDVKPANIMITPAGLIKLMDFGIAKGSNDRHLTMTGTTIGSLYYMSPEQIQGTAGLDARADLYSVGVTLYELITAKHPFDGDSQFAIMSAHLEKMPVPPIELIPSVPPMLNDIILLAVAKDPNARFQSAGAMRTALSNVLPSTNTPVPGERPFATPIPATAQPRTATVPTPVYGAPIPQASSAPPPAFTPQSPIGAPPSGNYAPPVMPPPPPPQSIPSPRSGSNRGLWMAIGALAAVAAAGAAVYFAPWKAVTASKTQSESTPSTQAAQPAQATQAVPPAPSQTTQPEIPAATTPAQTAVSAPPVQAQPTAPVSAAPSLPLPSKPAKTPVKPAAAPNPHPAAAEPVAPPLSQPAVAPPQPVAAPQPTPAVSQPAGPSRAEIQSMREHIVKLNVRANGINSSLSSLERSQQSMGLGLSSKFSGPRDLMNSYMQGAQEALNANDLESAKDMSAKAERQIEILEKLLNR